MNDIEKPSRSNAEGDLSVITEESRPVVEQICREGSPRSGGENSAGRHRNEPPLGLDGRRSQDLRETVRKKVHCIQVPVYKSTDALRESLQFLSGRKFWLDCGHRVTIGHQFGNNLIIHNGRKLEIICTLCGY